MMPAAAQLDRIMAVMDAAFDPAFGEAWNRRQVSDALAMPSTHALIMDAEGKDISASCTDAIRAPAGFVMTRAAADEEELLLIAVSPDCRGRGFGRALIARLFDHAKARGTTRIFLEMRKGNPAEHLYRASGFEPIGKRSNYYRQADGTYVDAITFGRTL